MGIIGARSGLVSPRTEEAKWASLPPFHTSLRHRLPGHPQRFRVEGVHDGPSVDSDADRRGNHSHTMVWVSDRTLGSSILTSSNRCSLGVVFCQFLEYSAIPLSSRWPYGGVKKLPAMDAESCGILRWLYVDPEPPEVVSFVGVSPVGLGSGLSRRSSLERLVPPPLPSCKAIDHA